MTKINYKSQVRNEDFVTRYRVTTFCVLHSLVQSLVPIQCPSLLLEGPGADLLVTNSFSACESYNILISCSFLKDILLGIEFQVHVIDVHPVLQRCCSVVFQHVSNLKPLSF